MSYTASELAKVLDTPGTLSIEELTIAVKVVDARQSFGNVHYQVMPIKGYGMQWVDSSRVKLDTDE